MSLKDDLIKLGEKEPNLQDHIRPVLDHLDREKSAAMAEVAEEAFGDLVESLANNLDLWVDTPPQDGGSSQILTWSVLEDERGFADNMGRVDLRLREELGDVGQYVLMVTCMNDGESSSREFDWPDDSNIRSIEQDVIRFLQTCPEVDIS